MAIIKPFQALRPKPEFAQQIASRPYDVLNREEAITEAKDNPYSFLHVTKSDIDLPEDGDIHNMTVYKKAKENLNRFIDENILSHEEKPSYYIYQLVMPAPPELGGSGRSQTGLVCVSSIEDYFNDVIKKHEFTRPEKEKDRIDHMLATKAQTGNVFLAYRDVPEVNDLISEWKNAHIPIYDLTTKDGIQHKVWVIDEDKTIHSITELFQTKVPCTYIADGHHRAASAANVSRQLPGNENAKYFLTTVFPASELAILDYNRVVKDLNGLTKEEFLKKLEDDFIVEKTDSAFSPKQLHQFGMYLYRQWFILTSKEGSYTNDVIGVLDV